MPNDSNNCNLESWFPDSVFPANNPSRVVLNHVTSRWGVLALCALANREMRWSELRRSLVGISEKMLAQTLKILENDGIVQHRTEPASPPQSHYSLTELGRELTSHLFPLMNWIVKHADQIVKDD